MKKKCLFRFMSHYYLQNIRVKSVGVGIITTLIQIHTAKKMSFPFIGIVEEVP